MGISVQWDASEKLLSGKQHYLVIFIVVTLFFSSFLSPFYATASNRSSSITCDIEFESPFLFDVTINNSIFTYIKMNDCVSFGQTGDPVLPVYPARILVPYGKKVVNVEVFNDPFIKIGDDLGSKPIIPQQEAFPLSKDNAGGTFLLNETSYSSEKSVFDEIYSIGDSGLCRGYEIFTVFLYPIQYIPKSGLIYYTPKITINVILEDSSDKFSENEHIFYRGSSEDIQVLSSIVENPEDAVTYGNLNKGSEEAFYDNGICDPADTYEYVIITSDSLSDTSGYEYNLSDLVNHREEYSGLNATIVTVEEIDACSYYWNQTSTFNDTQAHIREFCKDAYDEWNTTYMLLAGDWDSNPSHQIVPFRLFTDYYQLTGYNSMACDMYYSNLDGDWYYTSEDIWGGGIGSGANDLYAELFVGRITVSNAEHISNAVSKIINYDTNSSLTEEWLRSTSFWGGNLGWPDVNSKEYMEELRLGTDTYRTFTGFEEYNVNHFSQQLNTSERLYDEDLGPNYPNYFESCLTNDNASIINHLDHGIWSEIFSLDDWDSITNSKPFFGYSQGCLSGRFHNTDTGDSGCEMLICEYPNKHAYALVLNTGYGWGAGYNTDGASQYLQAYFWDYFFNIQSNNPENWQIGKAMAYSHDKMAAVINSNSHVWCYSLYSTHLFGDPAQKIRFNNSNTEPSLSDQSPSNGDTSIALNFSQLSVNITDFDSDLLNWTIETSPDVGNSSGLNDASGIKTCNISNLNYSTQYTWFVNVTDGYYWTNESYTFTTRSELTPDGPSSFATNVTRFQIQLSWIDDDAADFTLVEWNSQDDNTWNIGDHTVLYNGTNQTATQQNLTPGTTRYYKAWSYNSTDDVWSNAETINVTTDYNNAPVIFSPNPENDSVIENLSLNWSIQITDADNDTFNYSIESSNNQSITENNSNNGTKTITLIGLNYSTNYKIWVNASDVYNTTANWYNFTTSSIPHNNTAPIVTNPNPDNNTNNVEITLSSLTILINDSDGNTFNWSVETSPYIGNISGVNASNGTKECNVSSLSYSTEYTWFVNVTDGLNHTNKTYHFTTKSAPSTPRNPSGGGYIRQSDLTPQNTAPTSDAGGPYKGFINQSITFNGSNSADEDGEITIYLWDFGDGTTGYEETIIHTYSQPGNYTVKLTVTDNLNSNSTDETFAEIIQNESGQKENKTSPYNPDDMIISNIDSDNDKIPDEIEKQIGSDYESSDGVIILEIAGKTYCLIDTDNDGEIDVLYDATKEEIFEVTTDNGLVLIDINQDGKYDYYYESNTHFFAEYSSLEKTQDAEKLLPVDFKILILVLFCAISIICIILMLYRKLSGTHSNTPENSVEKYSSGYLKSSRLNDNLKENAVHFFSKPHKKRSIQKNKVSKSELFPTDDLDDYNIGSSLKNTFDKNLATRPIRKVGYESLFSDDSDSFMINNHVNNFRKYNRVNYVKSDGKDIGEQIDNLINSKPKDKFKEN